jgi:hypothetical protein
LTIKTLLLYLQIMRFPRALSAWLLTVAQ